MYYSKWVNDNCSMIFSKNGKKEGKSGDPGLTHRQKIGREKSFIFSDLKAFWRCGDRKRARSVNLYIKKNPTKEFVAAQFYIFHLQISKNKVNN